MSHVRIQSHVHGKLLGPVQLGFTQERLQLLVKRLQFFHGRRHAVLPIWPRSSHLGPVFIRGALNVSEVVSCTQMFLQFSFSLGQLTDFMTQLLDDSFALFLGRFLPLLDLIGDFGNSSLNRPDQSGGGVHDV